MRHSRQLALRVALLAFFLLCSSALAGQKVQWIYDGDTIKVAGVGKVRLIGIDTPEKETSSRDNFFLKLGIPTRNLRHIAEEALQFNISEVKGKTVKLSFDKEKHDRYGRLLAYVTLPDGRLLNHLLLEKGFAVVYRRFDFRFKEDFLQAEAQARREKKGLWKGGK